MIAPGTTEVGEGGEMTNSGVTKGYTYQLLHR